MAVFPKVDAASPRGLMAPPGLTPLGAKANSLPSVGVAYGYGSRQELEEAGAEKVADTVEDLRKLLLRGER